MQKIVTKNIKQKLPVDLINLIWSFYDEGYLEIEKDDYQYVKIQNNDKAGDSTSSVMTMWQEFPPVIKKSTVSFGIDCEIWIINDGNVVTMLLPEEY